MAKLSDHLCECGCGDFTHYPKQTQTDRGWIKGQPLRVLKGHGSRLRTAKGYRAKGHRSVHRLRAEAALGKPLPRGADVHHADGTKNADAPLVICQDRAYHQLLHYRARIKAAGGNPNTDALCWRCRTAKPRSDFWSDRHKKNGLACICKPCSAARQREWKTKRESAA